ncbi:hypothetical protein D3C78_1733010 [compost metagenome]
MAGSRPPSKVNLILASRSLNFSFDRLPQAVLVLVNASGTLPRNILVTPGFAPMLTLWLLGP